MSVVIAIDAGTSVIKAVAFQLDGRQIGNASVPNRYRQGADGSATQSMERTWRDCAQALRDLGERIPDLARRTVALAVTGQGDGTWLVNGQNAPVGEAWLWLDARAAPTVAMLEQSPHSRARFEATGTGLNTCQQGSQLAHMVRHAPELVAAADCAMHCKDWIYLNLTGQRATDPSEASFTFGNFRSRAYDPIVIEALGLTAQRHLLPPILEGTHHLDPLSISAAQATGLLAGTPVCLGYVDMVMTALGAGVFEPGQTGIACSTIGTTGVHMRAAEAAELVLNDLGTGYVICLPLPGQVVQLQSNMAATLNLDWILGIASDVLADFDQQLRPADLVPKLDGWLAKSAPGAALYLPYISDAGERGPFLNTAARAGFTGLAQSHGFGDLVRAVAEGLGHAMRDCYGAMGALPRELRLTGGAARSAGLRAILSAVVQAPVRVSKRDEAGAAGAAMMAVVGIGAYPDMSACIADWVTPQLCAPEPPDAQLSQALDRIFPAYQAARGALAPVWDHLAAARQQSPRPFGE